MGDKILIIEDEKDLAQILGAYLEVEGFNPIIALDGEEGFKAVKEHNPSLILLDIMLPKMNGIEVCKAVREKSNIPIIMISAKSGEMDKVIALGIGADDYVTKPFSPLELVARVKANLRRAQTMNNHVKTDKEELLVGLLRMNKSSYTATVDKQSLNLTTKEFDILYFLADNQNQVFTKSQIYYQVWGYQESFEDNSVTVYVNRIREKLSKYELEYIKTVWGAGYKFSIEG